MIIECQTAETLIELRLDGDIGAADDRALDAHVAGCSSCAAQLAAEIALDRQLAARLGRIEAPPSLAAGVRRRLDGEPTPAPSRAGWLADALNAGGIVVVGGAATALAAGFSPLVGAAILVCLLAVGCYPLLLSGFAGDGWSGDAGAADAGPARQAQ